MNCMVKLTLPISFTIDNNINNSNNQQIVAQESHKRSKDGTFNRSIFEFINLKIQN